MLKIKARLEILPESGCCRFLSNVKAALMRPRMARGRVIADDVPVPPTPAPVVPQVHSVRGTLLNGEQHTFTWDANFAPRLTISSVPADGNCLFHSLSRCLGQQPDNSAERIRNSIADWIAAHAEENPVIHEGTRLQDWADDVTWEQWVGRLREGTIWGSSSDIPIAARIFERPIVIWSTYNVDDSPVGWQPPNCPPDATPFYLLQHVKVDGAGVGNAHFDALVQRGAQKRLKCQAKHAQHARDVGDAGNC